MPPHRGLPSWGKLRPECPSPSLSEDSPFPYSGRTSSSLQDRPQNDLPWEGRTQDDLSPAPKSPSSNFHAHNCPRRQRLCLCSLYSWTS